MVENQKPIGESLGSKMIDDNEYHTIKGILPDYLRNLADNLDQEIMLEHIEPKIWCIEPEEIRDSTDPTINNFKNDVHIYLKKYKVTIFRMNNIIDIANQLKKNLYFPSKIIKGKLEYFYKGIQDLKNKLDESYEKRKEDLNNLKNYILKYSKKNRKESYSDIEKVKKGINYLIEILREFDSIYKEIYEEFIRTLEEFSKKLYAHPKIVEKIKKEIITSKKNFEEAMEKYYKINELIPFHEALINLKISVEIISGDINSYIKALIDNSNEFYQRQKDRLKIITEKTEKSYDFFVDLNKLNEQLDKEIKQITIKYGKKIIIPSFIINFEELNVRKEDLLRSIEESSKLLINEESKLNLNKSINSWDESNTNRGNNKMTISKRLSYSTKLSENPFLSQFSGSLINPFDGAKTVDSPSFLDLFLVIDISSSLSQNLNVVKEELSHSLSDLKEKLRGKNINIGFIGYRDFFYNKKSQTCLYLDLNRDFTNVEKTIKNLKGEGSGDDEENIIGALSMCNKIKWVNKKKYIIFITDSPFYIDKKKTFINRSTPVFTPTSTPFPSLSNSHYSPIKENIEDLIHNLAKNNINIYCIRISEKTDKFYSFFKDEYNSHLMDKSLSSLNIYPLKSISNIVREITTQDLLYKNI